MVILPLLLPFFGLFTVESDMEFDLFESPNLLNYLRLANNAR